MNAILSVIDTDLAIKNAGGNAELARDLHRMLQEELPGYLQEIQDTYQRQDYAALYQQVHKLNGSATYCGVPALKAAAHRFDTHLKQEQQEHYAEDMAEICERIEELLRTPNINI
ncbi:MAG: Hpt domain-containing protein [Chromatiales bacterium]|nr:Hpt domain-containing protein [Gammaproteobacteria bacterium]MBW6477215.1 Hpt domain-containing protein [Chromatiales bacterium]